MPDNSIRLSIYLLAALWFAITGPFLFLGLAGSFIMLSVANATGGIHDPIWELIFQAVITAPATGYLFADQLFFDDKLPELSTAFLYPWYGMGAVLSIISLFFMWQSR